MLFNFWDSICNKDLECGKLKLNVRASIYIYFLQFHVCINPSPSKWMCDWNIINCIHFYCFYSYLSPAFSPLGTQRFFFYFFWCCSFGLLGESQILRDQHLVSVHLAYDKMLGRKGLWKINMYFYICSAVWLESKFKTAFWVYMPVFISLYLEISRGCGGEYLKIHKNYSFSLCDHLFSDISPDTWILNCESCMLE